jgi:hypothetical protein
MQAGQSKRTGIAQHKLLLLLLLLLLLHAINEAMRTGGLAAWLRPSGSSGTQ